MGHKYAEIAFTDTIRNIQAERGSRAAYARREGGTETTHDRLGVAEAGFIQERDSFYMATVSETGWPYVQHRGGPPGFLRVRDDRTIGFADFAGNRQYITVGNLATDDRVSLFLMDYPNQTRLKILGRAEVIDRDSPEIAALVSPDLKARVERGILIRVEAFDWNCSQHITPRFTADDVQAAVEALRQRIVDLEGELARRQDAR